MYLWGFVVCLGFFGGLFFAVLLLFGWFGGGGLNDFKKAVW